MIIWLASYPKSGNTYLRSLLSSYLFTEDGNFQLSSLKQIKQFPSVSLFKKFGVDTSNDLELVKNYMNVQNKINLENKNKIRFMKTHSGFHDINGYKFTDLSNSLGVIYVVRDPRTIIKSFANHHQLSLEDTLDKMLNFSTLTEATIHSKNNDERRITHMGSWASNYNSWKEFKKLKKYFLIKYEDLVSDPEKNLIKILSFIHTLGKLDFKIDNLKLKNTLNSTTFNEMQKLETEQGFPEAVKDKDGNNITFFKYGPKENKPDQLAKNFKDKIEREFKNELKELSYI